MSDLSIFKLDTQTINIKDTTARDAAESAKTLATTASGNATTALNKINELESEKADAIISSASGAIASFPDGAESTAKKLVVGIEPVQEGTGDPSPDNVRPISGWTGAKVTVSPTTDAEDGHTYSITFPSEAGTVYGGTLDVTNGVLTVDRICHTYKGGTDNVITARGYDSTNTCLSIRGSYLHVVTSNGPAGALIIKAMCDKLPTITFDEMRTSSQGFAAQGNWAPALALKVPGCTTVAEYDAWCAANEPQISWLIATPITYHLTPQEITTLLGQNNIWADTGDTSVTYKADTKLYIDRKFTELQALILEN